MPPSRRQLLALGACGSALGFSPWPVRAAPPSPPTVTDETWHDAARQRQLPVRVRWPAGTPPPGGWPVVLFSHGLGGTRDGGSVWGQAWVDAGLVVVHLQHPGSDLDAVRLAARSFADQPALRQVASPQQLLARLRDVSFALDEIGRRHAAGQDLWAQARPGAVGMSGHSFGAHTTLGMAGQQYPGFGGISEPRLAAFVAFSPTLPVVGDARQAFARITRPTLCVTGTRDDDVVGVGATPERRIGVYAALPAGHKAQLVLADADHMTFGGQTGRAAEIVRREEVTRRLQPRHHALVAAITTDWWRAQLLGDTAAQARLVRPAGLAAGDTWQAG
ncbi:MAG: alpha/beta hydrolase family protein [Ramlibacter sp.]